MADTLAAQAKKQGIEYFLMSFTDLFRCGSLKTGAAFGDQ